MERKNNIYIKLLTIYASYWWTYTLSLSIKNSRNYLLFIARIAQLVRADGLYPSGPRFES